MSMGRMNNGLLTQDYMDELLNVGGADRQQYGTLMSPIVNPINQRVLGGLTEAKRARGGALDDYLSRYQQGIETLDENPTPPFKFTDLTKQQQDILMQGGSIVLDDRRRNVANIGGLEFTAPARKYTAEDFGINLPTRFDPELMFKRLGAEMGAENGGLPSQEDMLNQAFSSEVMDTRVGEIPTPIEQTAKDVVATPEERVGVDTTGAISTEDFIKNATQLGEPATAFPISPGTREAKQKKEEVESSLSGLFDIFDNKEALGKIALGIALLEGTPIPEAFEMYENFGGASAESLEIELVDRRTGEVVDFGADDNQRIIGRAQSEPENYSILPFGSTEAKKSDREELLLSNQIENSNKVYRERYADVDNTLISQLEQMRKIIDSGDFKSGGAQRLITTLKQRFNFSDKTTDDQVLFQSLSDYIVPRLRAVGSGSTSDFEVALFQSAAPSLDKSVDVNRRLINQMLNAAKVANAKAVYIGKELERNPSLSDIEREFGDIMGKISSNTFIDPDLTEKEKRVMRDIYGDNVIPLPAAFENDPNFWASLEDGKDYPEPLFIL